MQILQVKLLGIQKNNPKQPLTQAADVDNFSPFPPVWLQIIYV